MTALHDAPERACPSLDEPLFSHGRSGACVGAITLVSLLAFEAMAVSAAMPAISDALHGVSLYALVFGGLVATSAPGMVLAGSLCDRRGPWSATRLGLLLFTLGLLVAGTATSMGGVATGRVVQGLGSGMLSVALYVGMGRVVPPPLHPRLFAMFAAAWVLPGLAGPPLAAAMVTFLGWRAVFLVVAAVVPIAAVLLRPAFTPLARPANEPPPSHVARAAHPLLWACGAAAGVLALHQGSTTSSGLWRWPVMILGTAGVLFAARRLLPLGTLRARTGLPSVIALRGLLAAAFAGSEAFLPLLLTQEAHWSLAQAGLVLSSGAVLWSLGSSVQARLVIPAARQRGLTAGLLCVGTGLLLTLLVAAHLLPAWIVIPAWEATGFGIGLSFPMLSVLTLALSAPAEQGRHGSALQLSDALTTSLTLGAAGLLFNLAGGSGPSAFALVMGLCAALALLGAALSSRAFASTPISG